MNKRIKRLVLVLCLLFCVLNFVTTKYAKRDIDNKRPEITMDSETVTLSVNDPKEAVFSGVTVNDPEDGDVTDSLLVESMSNMDAKHKRTVILAAFDSTGNVSKKGRYVEYSDYSSPAFQIDAPLKVLSTKTQSVLEGITVTDVLDGDISSKVQLKTNKSIPNDVTDDYAAHLLVNNSAGDTVDLPVTLTACTTTDIASAPSIELSTYLIYLKKGQNLPGWKSFLKTVTISGRTWTWNDGFYLEPEEDGTIPELRPNEMNLKSSDIKIKQEVDTSTPGVYEVSYTVKAFKANPAATVRLIVVVQE